MDELFSLLRLSLNPGSDETEGIEVKDWYALYVMATQQSLRGMIYDGVAHLPENCRPPVDLMLQWYGEAEKVRDMNRILNDEAARLTRLFADKGCRTAILKGPANARLYPNPLNRQPGDIDIWVEGGRKSVLRLLEKMGLLTERTKVSYHHVHLPANERGVDVEVHFRPSSGNMNPFSNRRLQRWLKKEIDQSTRMVDEGFYVPSTEFALVMQLSHIQRHFLSEGIGLRQLTDYYILLRKSTFDERQRVACQLQCFGLCRSAGAVMWLLGNVFRLDESLMLCPPDEFRGEWMLREVMEGGNFGSYSHRESPRLLERFVRRKRRRLQLLRFDSCEIIWIEVRYWVNIVLTIPKRIRHRTFSLRDFPDA